MPTVEKTVEITNAKGLHVRAATVLAQVASGFRSEVTLEHSGERANGKSVMNLLLLTAARGTRVRLMCEGDDAELALAALIDTIANGFGE